MSDFRSLLSSFQAATGAPTRHSSTSSRSNDRTNSRIADGNRNTNEYARSNGKKRSQGCEKLAVPDDKKRSLLPQKIESLWRKSQIVSSTKAQMKHLRRQQQKQQRKMEEGVEMNCRDGKVTALNDESLSSSSSSEAKKRIHIAICATVVSSLPHEAIWRSWMSHRSINGSTCTSASMHIHAKSPSTIPNESWIKSKLIPISHNPNWNDVRIVQAMLSLAEFAMQDGTKSEENEDGCNENNSNIRHPMPTHIMYVTESCIPISTLDQLADMIRQKEKKLAPSEGCSFMDFYGRDSPRCSRFDEHACFSIQDVPSEAIFKALPGWCLLSALHVQQILDMPSQEFGGDQHQLYPLFKNVWAPEEVFFPTALALLGILRNYKYQEGDGTAEVIKQSIMWAKWDDRARGKERAHPIAYDGQFDRTLVETARESGCFFMRKLKKQVDVRDWEELCLISVTPVSLSESESTLTGCGPKREREGGSSTEAFQLSNSKKIEYEKKSKKARIS